MLQRSRRALDWRARRVTAGMRSLPRFIVIGGQRCGTTSLFDYLSIHPGVRPAFRKEIHYFDMHFDRGESWYRSHFALSRSIKPGVTTGDATPNYLVYPTAPERARAIAPNTKLVVLLRDPVERTHSSWRLNCRQGWEKRSFDQAIDEEFSQMESVTTAIEPLPTDREGSRREKLRYAYLLKSQYAEHIERWLSFYPRDQLLVLQSEHLFSSPEKPLNQLTEFLEIGKGDPGGFPRINETAAADDISETSKRRLAEHLKPHNERLKELVEMEFDWA